MAKLDLGHFIEAAGSVLQGQMTGKMQGQQMLQQQQEEDFQRRLQALNLRQQFDQQRRAQESAGLDTALRYGSQGLDPESRQRMIADVIGRQREIATEPTPSWPQAPKGVRWAGAWNAFAPSPVAPQLFAGGVGQPPTPPVTRPAVPAAPEPGDPYQQAMFGALRGASQLIPGGAGFLQALQTPPPPAAPEAPEPTVTYPGLGPGGAPATYQIETVSPKDIANQERSLQAANRNLLNASPNVVPIAQGYIRQWNSLPKSREDLAANAQILRNLETLGIGTGTAAVTRGFKEQAAEAKALGELPKSLRGQTVNENTVNAVAAQMTNAVEREDALNQERKVIGKPAISVLWGSQRDKIEAMNSNLEQGNAPEAMRLQGQVMDAVAFQQMKPQEQTRAMQSFLTAVRNAAPEQLTRENVLAMAEGFGIRHQVEDMVRAGMNFAAGPAAERLRKLLPQVKNFAQLDPESQKLLIDEMIPLAKLSGQKITIPARFVQQMTPAQRDASARGWANVKLAGERVEIARATLALGQANFNRLNAETIQKLSSGRTTGTLTESAAMSLVQRMASEARRTFDKMVTDTGMSGSFDPKKPGTDSISRQLKVAWDQWQERLKAVDNMARQLRRPIDVQKGAYLAPPSPTPGPTITTTTRMRGSVPTASGGWTAAKERRYQELRARQGAR